ncbi:hypothetical protein EYF80_027288 [Liparis tanakae]|uniref:Uncharacterized protein n=1 Tax=Liparis tanakae TaxID=230148 RepID=A0A4Z2HB43_9TELE|nr:hypothetical protein EYF80_027288 [Liparis tanakae]
MTPPPSTQRYWGCESLRPSTTALKTSRSGAVHRDMRPSETLCAPLCPSVPLCAPLCPSVPLCAPLCPSVPLCAPLCRPINSEGSSSLP